MTEARRTTVASCVSIGGIALAILAERLNLPTWVWVVTVVVTLTVAALVEWWPRWKAAVNAFLYRESAGTTGLTIYITAPPMLIEADNQLFISVRAVIGNSGPKTLIRNAQLSIQRQGFGHEDLASVGRLGFPYSGVFYDGTRPVSVTLTNESLLTSKTVEPVETGNAIMGVMLSRIDKYTPRALAGATLIVGCIDEYDRGAVSTYPTEHLIGPVPMTAQL